MQETNVWGMDWYDVVVTRRNNAKCCIFTWASENAKMDAGCSEVSFNFQECELEEFLHDAMVTLIFVPKG
jgi:hypothetical protein